MLNIRQLLRFWGRFLAVVIPFALIVSTFAVLTEVLSHKTDFPAVLLARAFWFSVILDMLPAIAVAVTVLWLAGRFLCSVHGFKSWKEGIGFLIRSRCGLVAFGPWAKIEGSRIARGNEVVTRIGGPGHLVIAKDSAVVLERGGRLARVEGPGFVQLESFERIYNIVDLRPKRWVHPVEAMTREGIPISWNADVRYQIADGGQAPTPKTPYPFSKEAVFRAATCKWRREAGRIQDMDWEGLVVISQTEGILRSILARRYLDELVGLTEADERAARESIQKELEQKLCEIVPRFGAKILGVKLDNLQIEDDAVTQQWIKAWKAKWQRWSASQLAQEEAARIYLYETAKAEAQMRLLTNITRAFQELPDSQPVTASVILMRLFSVLDRADFAASSRVFFPNQALEALQVIKQMLESDSDGALVKELDEMVEERSWS